MVNASLLPHQFCAEDHRVIIINFKLDYIAGYRVNIYTPNVKRLIRDMTLVVARYNNKAKKLIVSYKINRKLDTSEDE